MIWYRVRDLEAGRAFYRDKLGFDERFYDRDGGWARLERAATAIGLSQGEPEDGGVAVVDVADVKVEAAHLRDQGLDVGVVLEVHGQLRLVDVFDPDGNRIQLAQELS